jgi:DNA-directed RNA polymerase specialized sigma24 family protein
MNDVTSVTEWIEDLKAGCPDAAQKLWERYVEQVVRIAHRRLGVRPRRAADEQDIAQEAFGSFFACIEARRFPRLDDRNDLWQVLLMLTDRKAKEHMVLVK